GNNRSIIPLDVLGHTRAILSEPTSTSPWPDRKVWVILLSSVVLGIEHCNYCSSTIVSASHQLVLITSLPF
ncbi:hypothetical protein K440DRAFT_678636, partial [Wilcoxina mikolae CBS 423.85]